MFHGNRLAIHKRLLHTTSSCPVVWNIKKLDSAPEPFAQMVYAATVLVKTLLHVSLGDSLYVFSFSQGRSNAEKVEWAARKGC